METFKFNSPEDLTKLIRESKQYEGIRVGLCRIDPRHARLLLERNEDNRKPNQTDIDSYCRDLKANAWELNGNSVKVDKRGRLIDGQKRLFACIETGKAFDTLLIFNVPSNRNINTEQHEGAGQKMRGLHNPNMIAAVVRMEALYDRDEYVFKTAFKLTPREQELMVRRMGSDVLENAARQVSSWPVGVERHSAYAWSYLRFCHVADQELVDQFFEEIRSEECEPQVRVWLRRMRRAASKDANGSSVLSMYEKTWMIHRCFVAWMGGERIKKIQVPTHAPSNAELDALLESI